MELYMNERVFHAHADRLRSPERIAMLDLDTVVQLSTNRLKNASVLDVGTGTALFAEAFFKAGHSVAGIDINESMLDTAAKVLPDGDFKTGAAESIPYPDKSFDIVFFGHVLHETDDIVLALKEAKRVARKRIVILEWPYVEEPMGPPFGHRLSPEKVSSSAVDAGILEKVEVVKMKHMVMYRIDL